MSFDSSHPRGPRVAEQKPNQDRVPYVVYVSREDTPRGTPGGRQFSTMDDAAKACITLRQHGYKILRVRLPDGKYVTGAQIEWAIRMGVSSVKIALTRE